MLFCSICEVIDVRKSLIIVSLLLLIILNYSSDLRANPRCATQQITRDENKLWLSVFRDLSEDFSISSQVTYTGSFCASDRYIKLKWQDTCSKHTRHGDLVVGEDNLGLYRYIKSGLQLHVFNMTFTECEHFAAFMKCGSTQDSQCLATHWHTDKIKQCVIEIPNDKGVLMKKIYEENLSYQKPISKDLTPYHPQFSVRVSPVTPGSCTKN